MKRGKKMLKYKEIMGWVDCVCYEKKKNYFLKHQTKQKNYKKKIYLERGGL